MSRRRAELFKGIQQLAEQARKEKEKNPILKEVTKMSKRKSLEEQFEENMNNPTPESFGLQEFAEMDKDEGEEISNAELSLSLEDFEDTSNYSVKSEPDIVLINPPPTGIPFFSSVEEAQEGLSINKDYLLFLKEEFPESFGIVINPNMLKLFDVYTDFAEDEEFILWGCPTNIKLTNLATSGGYMKAYTHKDAKMTKLYLFKLFEANSEEEQDEVLNNCVQDEDIYTMQVLLAERGIEFIYSANGQDLYENVLKPTFHDKKQQ